MTTTRKKKKSKEAQLAEKVNAKLSKPENISKWSAKEYEEDSLNEILNSSNQYNITQLSKGNNKNYIIAMKGNDNVSIVLQATNYLTEQPTPEFLNDPTINWLAEKYTSNILFQDDSLMPGELKMLRFIEKCPLGLAKQIQDLHKNKIENKDNIFQMTCDVGMQISSLLDACEKHGVVWTDMKPGNFLLRENNQVAISDLKGFKDANSFETVVNSEGQTITLVFDITSAYVSEGFQSDMLNDTMGRLSLTSPGKDMLELWNQEYSYQLSGLLYHMATGEKRIRLNPNTPELLHGEVKVFNFNQSPFIDNEQGQLLKFVLENLSKEHGERMVHTDAARILNVIANEEKFNAAMSSVPNREVLTNDEKIAAISNVILTDERFKLTEANAAQPEARKSESKKSIFQRIMPFGSKPKADKYSAVSAENSQSTSSAAPENKTPTKKGRLTKHLSFKHGASKPQLSSSVPPKEAVAQSSTSSSTSSRKLDSRSLSSSNIFQMLGIKKSAVAAVNANSATNIASQSNDHNESEIQTSIKFSQELPVQKIHTITKSDNTADATRNANNDNDDTQDNEPPRSGPSI